MDIQEAYERHTSPIEVDCTIDLVKNHDGAFSLLMAKS